MMSNQVLSLFVFCGYFINTTISEKSGAYTSTLRGFKPCEKPSSRYLQEPIGKAFVEPYNVKKNLLKGNITIIRDTNNVKTNIQEFYSEGGKWVLTFTMKSLSCRSHFISDLIDTTDVVYDKKTCNIPKGTYSFELDYNAVDHLWAGSREYGRMLRRVEASTKLGTVLCVQFESDIVADQ